MENENKRPYEIKKIIKQEEKSICDLINRNPLRPYEIIPSQK